MKECNSRFKIERVEDLQTLIDARFVTADCWIWTGHRNEKHYPLANQKYVHRLSFEMAVEKPNGLYVHHACQVRCCVNPSHLEALTKEQHEGVHESFRFRLKRDELFALSSTPDFRDGYSLVADAATGLLKQTLVRRVGLCGEFQMRGKQGRVCMRDDDGDLHGWMIGQSRDALELAVDMGRYQQDQTLGVAI
jgi:hypothetical protein